MLWIALLAMTLAACGAEEPAAPSTSGPHPACIPRGDDHGRICGLAPPRRGAEYRLATVTDERFSVVLPAELAPSSGVVAVPTVPLRLNAAVTTAPPREAADRLCDYMRGCEPVAVDRARLPEPLTRWDDASGTIRDLAVTTLDLGAWTLVLSTLEAAHGERVARAISSSTGADGYPRLASTDPAIPLDSDWAGVFLWVPFEDRHVFLHVIPGCRLAAKQPDLGGFDSGPELELHGPETTEGGSWCAGGGYWVDVSYADRRTLELLHEKLRVVPG